jgi:hypothetical protein
MMPAGPIGSCWLDGSWSDTAWETGTWAGLSVPIVPDVPNVPVAVIPTHHLLRLTAVRDEIPIPAEQPNEVQAAVRAADYRLTHPGTRARMPMPAGVEPTIQQSLRAIRKRLERLP